MWESYKNAKQKLIQLRQNDLKTLNLWKSAKTPVYGKVRGILAYFAKTDFKTDYILTVVVLFLISATCFHKIYFFFSFFLRKTPFFGFLIFSFFAFFYCKSKNPAKYSFAIISRSLSLRGFLEFYKIEMEVLSKTLIVSIIYLIEKVTQNAY